MTLQEFIDKYKGKAVDWDKNYGAQCVDLYDYYCKEVIECPIIYVNGAADIWENYPKDYFTRIPNEATNMPVPGDIMIWNRNYGTWGHVAIVTEATVNNFKAFSQNDPFGTLSGVKQYSYNNVFGWLHPNKDVTSSTTTMDRRPYWFDLINKVIWNKPKEEISDQMVNDWVKEYPSQRSRSGKWDKLCLLTDFTGDSNSLTAQQLYDRIVAKGSEAIATKLAECETNCQNQKQSLIAKVISFLNNL